MKNDLTDQKAILYKLEVKVINKFLNKELTEYDRDIAIDMIKTGIDLGVLDIMTSEIMYKYIMERVESPTADYPFREESKEELINYIKAEISKMKENINEK